MRNLRFCTDRKMLMPEVHSCIQMVVENDKLKKALRRMKKENTVLKKELTEMKEEQKLSSLLKTYVTTRNMEVQTDPTRTKYMCRTSRPDTALVKKSDTNADAEKLSKMMQLHNNLMKRYERELRVNMEHLETITSLNLKVNELQQKLVELEQKKSLSNLHQKSKYKTAGRKQDTVLLEELEKCKKNCDKLDKENRKLKKELKGLDIGFFEEVEDIKFAFQQSAKLNKEYEKCLRQICVQFDIPYPHPEKILTHQI